MYIDKNIKIDLETLPSVIQDGIRKLKLFYEKNDWFHFDLQQKAMIISAKIYYHNGRIELNIYNALANKYQ